MFNTKSVEIDRSVLSPAFYTDRRFVKKKKNFKLEGSQNGYFKFVCTTTIRSLYYSRMWEIKINVFKIVSNHFQPLTQIEEKRTPTC